QEINLTLKEETDWKSETTKTLISRLVKKGALTYEVVGNRYHYHPLIERSEAILAETNSFFSRVGRASLAPILSHFVESKDPLTDEEIATLKRLLHEKGDQK
ncbi:MAG: BlaI/MecI/CopY family transcriptional regulator, partial [Verrucomicrobiota bacterium]